MKLFRHFGVILLTFALVLNAHAGEERAALLLDEDEVLKTRIDLIEKEREEIIAIYYLWDGVKLGSAALAAYRRAAKRGVKVRLIIDGLSALDSSFIPKSMRKWTDAVMPSASLSQAIFNSLQNEGVEVKIFNPIDLKKITSLFSIGLLSREHEKISYFKSQNTVLLGDRNWQAINFRMNTKQKNKSYRSIEVKVESEPASQAVRTHLDTMWYNSELLSFGPLGKTATQKDVEWESKKMDRLLDTLTQSKKMIQSFARMIKVKSVRFVHDVMDKKRKVEGMEKDILDLIKNAKRTVTIVSPYFSWTKKFKKALDEAIKERNIKVKIYVPALDATDAIAASAAFELQARRMSENPGYEIFLHKSKDMLHGKVVRIDEDLSLITSHNLDLISEFLNYESGFIIDSREFNEQVDQFIKKVHEESRPYDRQKLTFTQKCSGLLLKVVTENW